MRNFVSSKLIFLVLLIIFVASSWALFNPKMFFTHDFIHGVRIAEMSRALRDGQFPVRWSNNFGYGYGMPLFEFYAPFPYYVGSFFYLLGFSLLTSSKLLFILPTIGTLLGSYFLGKSLFGRTGGLVTAALITLAPYRALNVFIRGAISETWGIMAAVWVLYATVRMIKGEKKGWVHLVISLTILFLSHNLVTMMFVPFALLFAGMYLIYFKWAALHIKKNRSKTLKEILKALIRIAGTYALGAGLASFYLLPAIVEKNFTRLEETITGGYFDYSLHFLYIRQLFKPGWGYGGSEWGPNDPISFFLGFGELLGVALSVGLAGWLVYRSVIAKKKTIFSTQLLFLGGSFAALTGLALGMSLMRSKVVWDAIPAFKFIQFPWRFYSVALIFLGLLGSFFTVYIPQSKRYLVSALVIVLTIIVNTTYFKPDQYLEDASSLYYDNPARVQSHMSGILPDYIPKSLQLPIGPPLEQLVCVNALACQKTAVLVARTQEKLFETTVSQPTQIVLAIAEYPGWIVEVDGQKQEHSVTAQGLIAVDVKPGYHTIGARFGYTPVRFWADLVSAVSVLCFLIMLMYHTKKESSHNVS